MATRNGPRTWPGRAPPDRGSGPPPRRTARQRRPRFQPRGCPPPTSPADCRPVCGRSAAGLRAGLRLGQRRSAAGRSVGRSVGRSAARSAARQMSAARSAAGRSAGRSAARSAAGQRPVRRAGQRAGLGAGLRLVSGWVDVGGRKPGAAIEVAAAFCQRGALSFKCGFEIGGLQCAGTGLPASCPEISGLFEEVPACAYPASTLRLPPPPPTR